MADISKTLAEHWDFIIYLVVIIVWAVRIEQRGINNKRSVERLQIELDGHKGSDAAIRREGDLKLDNFEKAIWDQFRSVQDSLTRLVSDVSWVRGRLGSIDKETR